MVLAPVWKGEMALVPFAGLRRRLAAGGMTAAAAQPAPAAIVYDLWLIGYGRHGPQLKKRRCGRGKATPEVAAERVGRASTCASRGRNRWAGCCRRTPGHWPGNQTRESVRPELVEGRRGERPSTGSGRTAVVHSTAALVARLRPAPGLLQCGCLKVLSADTSRMTPSAVIRMDMGMAPTISPPIAAPRMEPVTMVRNRVCSRRMTAKASERL